MLAKSQTNNIGGKMLEAQSWLPTYAALCMVCLVFFAMLYSMSFFTPQRYEQSMHSIREALNNGAAATSSLEKDLYEKNIQAQLRKHVIEMQARAFDDIRAFIAQNGMEANIETVLEEGSIILRLSEGMLFTPGAEHILPAGINTLNQLKNLFIIQCRQTIHIRSYTDDNPLPPGARFKDNWELSALRAVHVLRHLLAQGIEPERLSATGFGELEPLFPNTTEENRAKNRRIEFMLERQLGKE